MTAEQEVDAAEELGVTPASTSVATQRDRDVASRYNEELDHEVHSYISLGASRAYSTNLLAMLPPYNQVVMATECLKQELKLQESIRQRSFSDGEMNAKIRRWLVYLVGYGSFAMFIFSYGWTFYHPALTDQAMSKQLFEYAKWSLGATLTTVLSFYFPKVKVTDLASMLTQASKTRKSKVK